RFVDWVEREVSHGRDVAAVGKDPGAGGHDLVGRDVVAQFEQGGSREAIRERVELGERDDVGALFERDGWTVVGGRDEHLGVDVVVGGWPIAGVGEAEVAWIGDDAGERGRGRGLGTAQVYLVGFGA